MFVSFTKTLKKMSGFRLGFGVRVNKRNAPLWCFAMLFAGMYPVETDQYEELRASLEKFQLNDASLVFEP